MSILIKGIDMPKEGEHIVALIKSNGKCSYWKQDTEYGICEPMQTVEAIQIPTPHGRIVDADDIKAKCINEVFESMGTVAITDPYPDDEWADDICDVPTILEAEE